MNHVSSSPNLVQPDRAAQLLAKWKPILEFTSKDVAPIESAHMKLNTAMLLENQERYCFESNTSGGTGGVFTGYSGTVNSGSFGGAVPANNDFYATGDARLPKVLIPMVRRTFPELITNEIVGVQPMSGPVGLAFALRYRYDGTNLACTTDDHCTTNGAAETAYTYRSFGTEAGYNFLNTAHTGVTAAGLSGTGLTTSPTSAQGVFPFTPSDRGVAEILRNFEFSTALPQMVLEIEKTAVEAGTRKLATKWSIELEQDIRNMNGIDIDAEMVNAMSYELQAEIDREMVMRMIQISINAGLNRGYSVWNPASADARWLGERNRDFYSKIIIEANRIAVRNRRGSANFIIATPSLCAILEMLPEFQAMMVNGSVNTQPTGVAKVGSVGGRFNVYRDTRTEAQYFNSERGSRLEYALLGYKGAEFYDTGIVYCPYIPVMVFRTQGVNDAAPRVQLMTRYGIVDNLFGAENFYHLIVAVNLEAGFTPNQQYQYLV